jgi:RimJ/RimL family protein N-acetyltransferase
MHVGFVVLNHEYGDAHAEIGWMLSVGAEGQGYATEAAGALLAFAHRDLGMPRLVSYVAPGNARSLRVAERLGGQRAAAPERGCIVFHHSLPEALQ